MLESINKHIKGWIAWTVVILIAITFSLWGMESLLEYRAEQNKVLAKVNGHSITEQELAVAFTRNRDALIEQFNLEEPITPELSLQLQQIVFQQLIVANILEQEAIRNALTTTQQQAETDLLQIPVFQEDGQFSAERFRQLLQLAQYSYDEFMQELKRDMLLNQLRAGVIGSAFTLPNEVEQAIKLINQQRDFRYLIISAEHFRDEIKPTEEQELAFYHENETIFYSPEQITVEYVELSLANLAQSLELMEMDVIEYYQEHFADDAGVQPELDSIADDIEQQLRYELARQQFPQASETLADLAFINPDSLEEAAEQMNLPIRKTGWFSRKGGDDAILTNQNVLQTAFSEEVLLDRLNSEPLILDDETVIVLRVSERQPSELLPFSEIQPLIHNQLIFDGSQAAAQAFGEQLQADLVGGKNIDTSLAELDIRWNDAVNVTRDDADMDPTLTYYAFSMPTPAPGAPLPTLGVTGLSGNYLFIQLQSVNPGDVDSFDREAQHNLRDQMEYHRGVYSYELYVQNLLQTADIDIYDIELQDSVNF